MYHGVHNAEEENTKCALILCNCYHNMIALLHSITLKLQALTTSIHLKCIDSIGCQLSSPLLLWFVAPACQEWRIRLALTLKRDLQLGYSHIDWREVVPHNQKALHSAKFWIKFLRVSLDVHLLLLSPQWTIAHIVFNQAMNFIGRSVPIMSDCDLIWYCNVCMGWWFEMVILILVY